MPLTYLHCTVRLETAHCAIISNVGKLRLCDICEIRRVARKDPPYGYAAAMDSLKRIGPDQRVRTDLGIRRTIGSRLLRREYQTLLRESARPASTATQPPVLCGVCLSEPFGPAAQPMARV